MVLFDILFANSWILRVQQNFSTGKILLKVVDQKIKKKEYKLAMAKFGVNVPIYRNIKALVEQLIASSPGVLNTHWNAREFNL